MPSLRFDILHRAADCHARVGRVTTPHGAFDTPAFMPVGTRAAVKGLLPWDVAGTGAQIILANTYHLMLRPGSDLIARMGGLHRWMNWPGPILTDSGGFQVFSLSDINRITDEGVTFKSHIDGATVELTPARSIQVQNQLGADVIVQFDDCPPPDRPASRVSRPTSRDCQGAGIADSRPTSRDCQGAGIADSRPTSRDCQGAGIADSRPTSRDCQGAGIAESLLDSRGSSDARRILEATERSARWLDLCVKAHARKEDQALFGIVQGGTDLALRTWSAGAVTQHDLPGYAIGGVAVGEGFDGLKSVVEHTAPLLPVDRPRYLMGVGYERDILLAVRAGVDMFDCVLPTRNGRNAFAFTRTGTLRLRNAKYADDARPMEEGCDCPACGGESLRLEARGLRSEEDSLLKPQAPNLRPSSSSLKSQASSLPFSRSYLRHLFMSGEMLGPILVSLHNLRHFQRYLLDIRRAITDNNWSLIARNWPVAVGQ